MLLGGAIVFVELEIKSPGYLSLIGAAYLWFGLRTVRQPGRGIFANQLGIATAAAGAALISGGLAVEAEQAMVGFIVSIVVAIGIVFASTNRILHFLAVALAAGFFVATLLIEKTPYVLDLAALATPAGLLLLLRPPDRDMTPTAIVLLLLFPILSIFAIQNSYWVRDVDLGGWVARAIHIVLFLWLVSSHWARSASQDDQARVAVIALPAVVVCILLPPGGSAAMLLMALAFVIGSRPFALLGVLLQIHFLFRYYYSLEMNLLDKSLLLMAVGAVLLAAWWLVQRSDRRWSPS